MEGWTNGRTSSSPVIVWHIKPHTTRHGKVLFRYRPRYLLSKKTVIGGVGVEGGEGGGGRRRAAASKLELGGSSMPVDMTSCQISLNFVIASSELKDVIDFIQKSKMLIDGMYFIH